jgi:hypothetical protein
VNTHAFYRGHECRFRLADVICPDRQQMLNQITADLEVSGRITFLSDEGERKDCFAIIEVDGIGSPLIVPVERLQDARSARRLEAEETPASSHDPHI